MERQKALILIAAAVAAALGSPPAGAVSAACLVRATTCIHTQGTTIPSKQVIDMLDRCEEFTTDDLGRRALTMSYQEVNAAFARTGLSPLVRAWHAFGDLYDSPLQFTRQRAAERTSYDEIKRACALLNTDFGDDKKWLK